MHTQQVTVAPTGIKRERMRPTGQLRAHGRAPTFARIKVRSTSVRMLAHPHLRMRKQLQLASSHFLPLLCASRTIALCQGASGKILANAQPFSRQPKGSSRQIRDAQYCEPPLVPMGPTYPLRCTTIGLWWLLREIELGNGASSRPHSGPRAHIFICPPRSATNKRWDAGAPSPADAPTTPARFPVLSALAAHCAHNIVTLRHGRDKIGKMPHRSRRPKGSSRRRPQ